MNTDKLTAKDTKNAKVRAAQAIMKAKKQPRKGAKGTKPLITDERTTKTPRRRRQD
jgi:hypothetical protein